MATWILINSVKYNPGGGGTSFLSAGEIIDDTKLNLTKIKAAGGVVSQSSDLIVSAAQKIAAKLKKEGQEDKELDRIMLAAYALSSHHNEVDTLTSSGACGATVAAAAAIVPAISFTPQSTGRLRIRFWANFAGFGAGVVTPLVKQAATTIAAPAQYTGQATVPYNVSGEVIVSGLAIGTAVSFSFVTTAGDATVTIGAGATGIGAGMTVEEMG
jgi:hypothetical protein